MPDMKRRTLIWTEGRNKHSNTENPWLNVIITVLHTLNLFLVHLYAYFQQLSQYFLHCSRSYIESKQGKSAFEINTCISCRSGVKTASVEIYRQKYQFLCYFTR